MQRHLQVLLFSTFILKQMLIWEVKVSGGPAASRVWWVWRTGSLINDSICALDPKWKNCFVLSEVARAQVPSGLPSPPFPSIYWQNLSGPSSVAQGNISQESGAGARGLDAWAPTHLPAAYFDGS